METTLRWLRQYVPFTQSAPEIDALLTMSGTEVEERVPVASTGDVAFKLEVTSNRPDCYGALGLARELAALTGAPFTEPARDVPRASQPVAEATSVTLECADLCPYYTAAVIRGVTVRESPQWLLDYFTTLAESGVKDIRPVNNVVDLTNFVMLETGQPLHAFDYDRLAERRIVVRRARAGETLRAIDDRDYALDPSICVIADAERPQCLGGVMGGKATEIGAHTKNLLLEAAVFAPLNNRRTTRALRLFSDSSYRFSRGVDPAGVLAASERAAALIVKHCGGELLDGVVEAGAPEVFSTTITFRQSALRRTLGIEVDRERVIHLLGALGLTVTPVESGTLEVTVPSYRRDLTREIDLVEEVGRLIGYDAVPARSAMRIRAVAPSPLERTLERVRELLPAAGFLETWSDSFVPETADYAVTAWPCEKTLVAESPVRAGEGRLRPSLMPSLLNIKKHNQDHGTSEVRLFETARVYLGVEREPLPHEPHLLGVLAPAPAEVKGVFEALAETLGVAVTVEPVAFAHFAEGSGARLIDDEGVTLAVYGRLARESQARFDLLTPAALGELDLDRLAERARFVATVVPLPKYPGMRRELAVVLTEDTSWAALRETVRRAGGPLLSGVRFLKAYRGKPVPKGRKQYQLELAFAHKQRSLTAGEVNEAQNRIVATIGETLGGMIRK